MAKICPTLRGQALPKARAGNKGGVGRGGMQRPPGRRSATRDIQYLYNVITHKRISFTV